MRTKRTITDDLDETIRYEVERLLSLEEVDRGIKREQEELDEVRKEVRGRIAELEKMRNQLLEQLEKFRIGNRALPFEDAKVEPGADG